MKIISDPLLQFIFALSFGGFVLSVGLQYNTLSVIVVSGILIVTSYIYFIPVINKKQKEENNVAE